MSAIRKGGCFFGGWKEKGGIPVKDLTNGIFFVKLIYSLPIPTFFGIHERISMKALSSFKYFRLVLPVLALAGLLWTTPFVSADEWPEEPVLFSEAAILMDADTGQILYAKNINERMYPASITKVLTGYLALRHAQLQTWVTMSETAYLQVPRTSSHIALLPEETFSMEDALYALALVSANDAATAIAETVSGTVENFAELMNQQARAMGATQSHFVNPNGMPDENHYTTALDMARITAEAIKMPEFIEIFGSKSYTFAQTNRSPARELVSKNQFIDETWPMEGLLFSKTGWTSAAQGTLVTAVERNGVTLIAVTLKSPMLEDKYTDTMALINYGFDSFTPLVLEEADMEKRMAAHGMGGDYELDGYEPLRILVPAGMGKNMVDIVIPGGFDGSTGVTVFPVTVGIACESGQWLPLRDTLVAVRRTKVEEALSEQQSMTAAMIEKKIIPQWLWALPAVGICLTIGIRKYGREKSGGC